MYNSLAAGEFVSTSATKDENIQPGELSVIFGRIKSGIVRRIASSDDRPALGDDMGTGIE